MSITRILFGIAVLAQTATAQRGRHPVPPPQRRVEQSRSYRPDVRTHYTARDRSSDSRIIVSWYQRHPSYRWSPPAYARGRGHGLARGYERRLIRSSYIPYEYRDYVVPAPYDLVRTLPPVRPGWEFVVVGNRVLLVDRPSWLIIDVVAVL